MDGTSAGRAARASSGGIRDRTRPGARGRAGPPRACRSPRRSPRPRTPIRSASRAGRVRRDRTARPGCPGRGRRAPSSIGDEVHGLARHPHERVEHRRDVLVRERAPAELGEEELGGKIPQMRATSSAPRVRVSRSCELSGLPPVSWRSHPFGSTAGRVVAVILDPRALAASPRPRSSRPSNLSVTDGTAPFANQSPA